MRAGPARRLERQLGEVTEASDACPGTRPHAQSVGETLKGYDQGSDVIRLTFWISLPASSAEYESKKGRRRLKRWGSGACQAQLRVTTMTQVQ